MKFIKLKTSDKSGSKWHPLNDIYLEVGRIISFIQIFKEGDPVCVNVKYKEAEDMTGEYTVENTGEEIVKLIQEAG